MNKSAVLQRFREVGENYTYASLASVLAVTGASVRGYLLGYIRPSQSRQYQRMRLVILAHEEGIATEGLDLQVTRGTGRLSFEPRADRAHRLDCGRGFSEKRARNRGANRRIA